MNEKFEVTIRKKKYSATKAQVEQLRDWALDCEWDDKDDIEDLPEEEILRGVEKHFSGGLNEALRILADET